VKRLKHLYRIKHQHSTQPPTLELSAPILLSDAPAWINEIPCLVSAGFPSPAEDHMVQRVDLMTQLIRHPQATYLLRVRGESMRDAARTSAHGMRLGAGIYLCPSDVVRTTGALLARFNQP
jgi:SOS-response transcriptional repressor LexA